LNQQPSEGDEGSGYGSADRGEGDGGVGLVAKERLDCV
jgi:hypothetical protein